MNIAHTVCVRGSKGHVMTMSGSPKGVPRRSKGVLSRGGEKISGRPWAPILTASRTLKEQCCKRRDTRPASKSSHKGRHYHDHLMYPRRNSVLLHNTPSRWGSCRQLGMRLDLRRSAGGIRGYFLSIPCLPAFPCQRVSYPPPHLIRKGRQGKQPIRPTIRPD